ncbi:RluA family pseudouridine synthase [Candidatus Kaiserbacteria bacterium]|nr:RluA family pseudouridine synthase [Candidatus Kaiserbacteria bacterium]
MNIPIIYEDDSVLVIDKPAGLVVHPAFGGVGPDGKTKEETLTDWIRTRYPDMRAVGEPLQLSSGEAIARPGIVHRIDRETSGVLIIAKTQESFAFLKKQFQNREVFKEYRAFVYGVMKDDSGIVNRPIGRSSKDFRLRSAQRGARGTLRDAVTDYTVLKRGKSATYVAVMPKTGRTHQIRAHFKAVNHPIVCDTLYAPKRVCELGFTRLALHASRLELEIPHKGKTTFEAPLPPDFEHALKLL